MWVPRGSTTNLEHIGAITNLENIIGAVICRGSLFYSIYMYLKGMICIV